MVPKIAAGGGGFGGAGRYYLNDKRPEPGLDEPAAAASARRLRGDFEAMADYALHDKGSRQTAHRVGFTQTLNMATDDPHQAVQQMTASYDAFREREKNKRGRKLTQPLYPYSLSWAPDEKPTPADMMAAVHSSLKALGLEGLQTLVVQHTDEPHPHVHVLVNRIEQDGSRARNIPYDKLKLSRWAEQWERDHGGIRCKERVQNNDLRRQGQPVKDEKSRPYAAYKVEREARRQAFKDWRQAQDDALKLRQKGARGELARAHQAERRALEHHTQSRIEFHRQRLKERYKPLWSDLYRQQKAEKQAVAKMGTLERLAFIGTNRKRLFPNGMTLEAALPLVTNRKRLVAAVERLHERARADLSGRQKDDYAAVARNEWTMHRRIATTQMEPRQQMERDRTSAMLADQWRQIRAERQGFKDAKRFEAEMPFVEKSTRGQVHTATVLREAFPEPPAPAEPAPPPSRPTLSPLKPATIEAAKEILDAPAESRPRKRSEITAERERAYAERLRKEGKSSDFGREL